MCESGSEDIKFHGKADEVMIKPRMRLSNCCDTLDANSLCLLAGGVMVMHLQQSALTFRKAQYKYWKKVQHCLKNNCTSVIGKTD